MRTAYLAICISSLAISCGIGDALDAKPEKQNPLAEAETSNGRIFGIMYSLMHCPTSPQKHPELGVNDISKGSLSWGAGPKDKFWWAMPDAGYYCLSQNDAVLEQHAKLLRDAGIDFVYVDITNHPDLASDIVRTSTGELAHARSDNPEEMIEQPLLAMVRVWSNVPKAPKIIPWVAVVEDNDEFPEGDMIKRIGLAFVELANTGSALPYIVNGKPVIFIAPIPKTVHSGHPRFAENKLKQIEQLNLVILQRVWSDVNSESPQQGQWSYMSRCGGNVYDFRSDAAFRRDKGLTLPCNQQPSSDGLSIAVTPAYQRDYMSREDGEFSAIPRYEGRTFLRQMEGVYNRPQVPVVLLATWNEWTVSRVQDAEGIHRFTDQFNYEFSRDFEPGAAMGDRYYRLMKQAIKAIRDDVNPMTLWK